MAWRRSVSALCRWVGRHAARGTRHAARLVVRDAKTAKMDKIEKRGWMDLRLDYKLEEGVEDEFEGGAGVVDGKVVEDVWVKDADVA